MLQYEGQEYHFWACFPVSTRHVEMYITGRWSPMLTLLQYVGLEIIMITPWSLSKWFTVDRTSHQRRNSRKSVLTVWCFKAGPSIQSSFPLGTNLCSGGVPGNDTSPSGRRVSVLKELVCEPSSLSVSQSTAVFAGLD